MELAIDELAFSCGRIHSFRLSLLTGNPEWTAVLNAVANLANWSAGPPSGHYYGIAICAYANSVVAEVADISLVAGNGYDGQPSLFKVNNVYIALDCYLSVNPGQINAQLAGGAYINAALNVAVSQTSFVNGAAQFPNYYQNRVIRMDEMPQVQTVLIPNPAQSTLNAPLGGVGELGVPALAPALV